MKKYNFKKVIFLVLLSCSLCFNPTNAQESGIQNSGAHEKGSHFIGTGIGLYHSGVGVFGQYDYGVHKDWSIGTMFGVQGPFGSILALSFRGDFHLGRFVKLPSSMDWYAGLHAGINFLRLYGHAAVHSGFRYFFHERNVGIQVEGMGGFNSAGLQVGAVWKLAQKQQRIAK